MEIASLTRWGRSLIGEKCCFYQGLAYWEENRFPAFRIPRIRVDAGTTYLWLLTLSENADAGVWPGVVERLWDIEVLH